MLAPWRDLVHKYETTIIRITQCRDIQFLEQLCLISRLTSPSQTMRAPLTHIAKTKITKLEKIKSSLTSWHCFCPRYLVMLDTLVTPSFRYRAGYKFPSQWPCLTEPWTPEALLSQTSCFVVNFHHFELPYFEDFLNRSRLKMFMSAPIYMGEPIRKSVLWSRKFTKLTLKLVTADEQNWVWEGKRRHFGTMLPRRWEIRKIEEVDRAEIFLQFIFHPAPGSLACALIL